MRSASASTLARRLILLALISCCADAAYAAADGKDPTKSYRVPPRPIGSAQAAVKPGLSHEESEKAYKESGRPPFDRAKVKHVGDAVERE
jgi:hypothetical protein